MADETNNSKLEVPEGAPPEDDDNDNAASAAESSSCRSLAKVVLFGIGVFLLLGIGAFGVAYPILENRKSDSDSGSASVVTEGTDGSDNGEVGVVPDNNDVGGEDEEEKPPTTLGTSTTTNTDGNGDSPTNIPPILQTESGALPLFSQGVTTPYQDDQEMEHALTETAKLVLDATMRNMAGSHYGIMAPQPMISFGGDMMVAEAASSEVNKESTTDYGTNNQEEDVDEADIIKADSKYVYAAYGDTIVVWDTQGNIVTKEQMPPIPSLDGDVSKPPPMIMEDPIAQTERSAGGGGERRTSWVAWDPKPDIASLILTDLYIVAIVQGYGSSLRMETNSFLYGYMETQIRLYDKRSLDTDGSLSFVGLKNVNGNFVDARAIGNDIHLATITGINTYDPLTKPFMEELGISYGSKPFGTDEESQAQAKEAFEKVVPTFVSGLMKEVSATGESTDLLKINRWQTATSDSGKVEDMTQGGDLLNNLATVTSFNVNDVLLADDSSLDGELTVSSSSFFTPSWWFHMYATEDMLILATQGWNWMAELSGSEQTTYLLGLKTDGATTSFVSVGTLKGYLLNPYSLDIVDNDLRVATTIRQRWFARPMPIIEGGVATADEAITMDSMTENYVTVLEIISSIPGEMTVRGTPVQIGEKDEVITAVRFFDNVAYAVTFERTDPFYVLDMGETPKKLGELKIPGFSSYLHSMNDENSLLVAVGQNATETGTQTGLMISVFDSSDPTNPTQLVSYAIEIDTNGHSSSASQWDFKSFRYVDGKLILPVDIYHYRPWTANTSGEEEELPENFRGFIVFDVTTESIEEKYRISHGEYCYCGDMLSPRSFVYNGELMTVQDSLVILSDFDSGSENLRFSINTESDEDSTFGACCTMP